MHARTRTHTHTPWPNESETLGMGPGNLTPGAADAGWSSWATSNWWNLIPWASWKSTKDHSCQWFRRRRQTGNSLQIRGEGEHGQLTRAIFPDDLSLIPFWNVGSHFPGEGSEPGTGWERRSWDPKQSWSNTYPFETSVRSHLVCFLGQAPRLQRREPCVSQKKERKMWQTGCLETLSRGIKWKSLKCPGSQREMSVDQIRCIGCQRVTSKSESKFLLTKKKKNQRFEGS